MRKDIKDNSNITLLSYGSTCKNAGYSSAQRIIKKMLRIIS